MHQRNIFKRAAAREPHFIADSPRDIKLMSRLLAAHAVMAFSQQPGRQAAHQARDFAIAPPAAPDAPYATPTSLMTQALRRVIGSADEHLSNT